MTQTFPEDLVSAQRRSALGGRESGRRRGKKEGIRGITCLTLLV